MYDICGLGGQYVGAQVYGKLCVKRFIRMKRPEQSAACGNPYHISHHGVAYIDGYLGRQFEEATLYSMDLPT